MPFRKLGSKLVEAQVAPGRRVFARRGAMIAYKGEVVFAPDAHGGGGGPAAAVGRRLAGEAAPLLRAEGSGTVLFGRGGHHVEVVELDGDTLYVEADRLLAFDGALERDTVFLGSQGGAMGVVRGRATGQGLFTTALRGHGSAAVMARGGAVRLPVEPDRPVHVDPQAYVAHRGDVTSRLSAAVGWRDVVGRGSGEALRLEMSGRGAVFVQASEEKL